MAEVLGLVSSVITVVQVAGKLGTSTVKLKRLWDEVQDVPAGISRCLEQLELLAPALEEMDTELQRTRDIVQHDSAAKRSLEYARKAMEKLEGMAEDMQNQIESARRNKKLLVQLKVRLKKDMMDEHHQQLQTALQFLFLSQQTYLIALTRLQPSIIMSEFRALQKQCRVEEAPQPRTIKEDEDPETQTENSSNPDRCRAVARAWSRVPSIPWQDPGLLWRFSYQVTEREAEAPAYVGSRKTKVFQARLQLPSWLLQKAWDFQAVKAYGGWKLQLQNWNTVPDGIAVFDYAYQGRLDLVLQLFEKNEASLYDRNAAGITLLEVAFRSGNLELATTLCSMGLKPTQITTSSLAFSIYKGYSRTQTRSKFMDLLRNWNEEEQFIGLDLDSYLCADMWWKDDMLLIHILIWKIPGIIDLFFPGFYLLEIFEVLNGLVWQLVDPQVMRQILKRDKHISPAAFRSGLQSSTRPHSSLYGFAQAYFHTLLNCSGTEMEHWRLLARWMLAGATAREIARPTHWRLLARCMLAGATAREIARPTHWAVDDLPLFCSTIKRVCRLEVSSFSLNRWVTAALSMWLEDLAEAGVDLDEYIQWEIATCRGEIDLGPATEIRPGIRFFESGPSLTVLAHGRHPRDWRFEWDPCVEEFVGEFWEAVDAPERGMPGAWVDDIGVEDEHCVMGLMTCRLAAPIRDFRRRDATSAATGLKVRSIPQCEKFWPLELELG